MDSAMEAPPRKFNFKRVGPISSTTEDEGEITLHRFNMFVLGDYEVELRLKPCLFQNRPDKYIPADVILISSLGMWAVELGRCSCHQKWTLSGEAWEDYTRRHLLKAGDVIWFEVVGDMVWRTYVFDTNSCCEKVFAMPGQGLSLSSTSSAPAKKKMKSSLSKEEEDDDFLREGSSRRKEKQKVDRFIAKIPALQSRSNFLNIPAAFVKANVCVSLCDRAILVDSRGSAWEMEVYYPGNKQANFKYLQFRGWYAFMKAHRLEAGDSCVFQIDDDSLLGTSSSFVMKVEIRK